MRLQVCFGGGGKIRIADGARLKGMTFWMEGDGNLIQIGCRTTAEDRCQIAACEGTSVTIGDNCMLSHDIYIRTSDSHPITNAEGIHTNPAANITTGDNVWIGMQCLILKGARIPDGCVVGARSTVTSKPLKANSLVVGTPAVSVKEDIGWRRK